MRQWPHRFKDRTVTSEDFIKHAVDMTGDRSLDGFLRDWLFGAKNPPMPGHPDWTAGA
jgi:hypothetical protein